MRDGKRSRRRAAALLAVLCVVAFVFFWGRRVATVVSDTAESLDIDRGRASPGLEAAPSSTRRGRTTAPDEPAASEDAGSGAPVPRPADPTAPRGLAPPVLRIDANVRLALLGTGERLTISSVFGNGVESRDVTPPALDVVVGVVPGGSVGVFTSDRRVVASFVEARVPNDVPSEIELRIPARDDPRLVSPVLRVTDAVTGKPLPDARLDPGRTAPWLDPLRADAEGRIRVPADVARWLRRDAGMNETAIVADDEHYPLNWAPRLRYASDWIRWDQTGEFPISLERMDAEGHRPLSLRLLDAGGSTVPNALLIFHNEVWIAGNHGYPARTDAAGVASGHTFRAFVVDVFVRGSVVASWVLGRDEGKEADGKPRDISLPALAPVHLDVRDAGSSLVVLARMAKAEILDAGAIEMAKKAGFSPGDDFYIPGEPSPVPSAPGQSNTFDFLAPVDRSVTLTLRRSGGDDSVRTLDVRAAGAAPLRIERAWDDLPRPR